jgi:hypothetical protein
MKCELKDSKGNLVVAIENSDPTKSQEEMSNGGFIALGVMMAAIFAACGISSIKEKIDAKKAKKAEELLKSNKQFIMNSPQFKDIMNKTASVAKLASKLTTDFSVYFKKEIEILAEQKPVIAKYKQQLLKGLEKPVSEAGAKKEIVEAVIAKYLGKDDFEKSYADVWIMLYDYEGAGVESTEDEWDEIWPDVDDLIEKFPLPNDDMSKKIDLHIEDGGWSLRYLAFDVINLIKDITIELPSR